VILTFDDGYADNFEGALLPLVEHNMQATWFITTDCIGSYANWMGSNRPETKMLDKQQLREMADQGMEIGSHTCSHPDLGGLNYTEQLEQVRTSKKMLESLLDSRRSELCVPIRQIQYGVGKSTKKDRLPVCLQCTLRMVSERFRLPGHSACYGFFRGFYEYTLKKTGFCGQ